MANGTDMACLAIVLGCLQARRHGQSEQLRWAQHLRLHHGRYASTLQTGTRGQSGTLMQGQEEFNSS